jgi:hypothetical protein
MNDTSLPESDEPRSMFAQRLALAGAGALIVLFFAFFSAQDRGVVAAFSFAAIIGVVTVKRYLLRRLWFTSLIALFIAMHGVAVYFFTWSIDVHPTILLAPFAIIDAVIMMVIVDVIEKRVT